MRLLVLSNGHGEDQIAVRIVKQLQSIVKELELAALPIVGQGYAYKDSNITIAGRVKQMPSGGFIYMGGNPLWQDLRGGLVQLTLEQIKLVRQWGKNGGAVLAVGDIVPLLYAWLSRANYAFVGTAKSEYYLRDEQGWLDRTSTIERSLGSVYLPWERWLMSRDACKGVFPRDSLTAKVLQQHSIAAYDLGNPMMDRISTRVQPRELVLNVLLLAGSRMPEALRNWRQILVAISKINADSFNKPLQFLGAIAPALNLDLFIEAAIARGWEIYRSESQLCILKQNDVSLILQQSSYDQLLHQADVAIAMAGTATEEFVGLGKPAIVMPGEGPQFTPAFAEAQSRLLGCSVIMVESSDLVGETLIKVMQDERRLQQIALNGKRRMGEAGAAKRIAQCLQQTLLAESI
ncbi:MAG: lipid-A-disaccharide synthase-related protein [Cyanobacteria bacterium P01_G01_bin.19]